MEAASGGTKRSQIAARRRCASRGPTCHPPHRLARPCRRRRRRRGGAAARSVRPRASSSGCGRRATDPRLCPSLIPGRPRPPPAVLSPRDTRRVAARRRRGRPCARPRPWRGGRVRGRGGRRRSRQAAGLTQRLDAAAQLDGGAERHTELGRSTGGMKTSEKNKRSNENKRFARAPRRRRWGASGRRDARPGVGRGGGRGALRRGDRVARRARARAAHAHVWRRRKRVLSRRPTRRRPRGAVRFAVVTRTRGRGLRRLAQATTPHLSIGRGRGRR